ncbi:Endonuclease/exonuclease/phosphatase [Crassisporium funariophilum]|nr:Endonuclease/exonuclease/phosphatase [Crassisporium funariophilum]
MATQNQYAPTPEQLALAKIRKQKKSQQSLQPKHNEVLELISRPWLTLPQNRDSGQQVKILSWNLLAQCLIRRELFPTSDCLKVGQREPMIHAEILRQNADVVCLQEVDRLEVLLPALEKAGYGHIYGSGPMKKHGCLIAFKNDLYSLVADKLIFYDDQWVSVHEQGQARTGGTRKTRNVGLLVSLQSKTGEKEGLVVATTHLFWHPKYTYERTRQAGILVREVATFRAEQTAENWPCIVAGDFNFTPSDPAYSLATGDLLLEEQEEMLAVSSIIHSTIDPSVLANVTRVKDDTEEGSEAVDPDRVITQARPANPQDGLLTVHEIVSLYSTLPKLRSAYSDGLSEAQKLSKDLATYGTRVPLLPNRHGRTEPEYTSYTHHWKSVLGALVFLIRLQTYLTVLEDYIFIIDPKTRPITVVGLLAPFEAKDMVPGLPRKTVSGSDHISLVAELCW